MSIFTTEDGNKLNYAMHGNGNAPMLMLHGLSQSTLTFTGMLETLLPGRTLYLCDLPGHGDSYRPASYRAETMINDVAELLRDVINKPAIVYGHSLGSLIASGVAACEPELVSKLILSDPPLIVWDEPRWKKSIISSYFGWARKTLNAGLSVEQIVPMLQVAFPHRSKDVLKDQAIALSQMDAGIIDATLDAEIATRDDIMALFEKIRCPTLLLQADPRILAAASDEDILAIQARIKNTQHLKFAGADHDLHLWKQQKILEAVLGFIKL